MNKRIFFLLGGGAIFLALIIGLTIFLSNRSSEVDYAKFGRAPIVSLSKTIDYDAYDLDSVIPADDNTGNLPEKVIGNPATAKVVVFEYADYGCNHCAETNAIVNKLISDYDGEVAIVFRTLVLSFPNSVSAASAATAASIQGYWEKYKNLLFSNQAEWFYLKGDSRDGYFKQLFVEASNGAGDVDKFMADMKSESVARRLAFNYGAAEALDITATPNFRINGEKVLASDLNAKIDELLGN